MKTTNKILSIILAIFMAISFIPLTASAAAPTSGTCGENVTWEFDKSTGTLYFFGTGSMNNIYNSYYTIPWISYQDDIENVVISEGIYTIVNYAFYNCDNLVNVTLPNTLTYIGDHTFEECESLTNITIPDSVIGIGDYAFSCCYNLTSVIIPNSVTEIGEDAFSYCASLTSITLSNNITAIKCFTFLSCVNLTSVTIPEGVKIIEDSAFHRCESLTNITIPDSVTIVRVDAFENCNSLTDVYYSGTEEQWKQISIKAYNWDLTGANIHYNSTGADTHPYLPVVIPPTCTEQGYTTYICACGYSNDVVENYLGATGHSHTSEITIPATHLTTGVETFTCNCGDSYTEVIEKIAEHSHEAVITAPTCTEQGYTTYTCECGDSYVDGYVDATGHNYESKVIEPSCTNVGYTAFTCACGDNYFKDLTNATGHTPADAVEENYIAPTCENAGSKDFVVYCSECDEEISRETAIINATGHSYTSVVTPPTCTEQGYTTYTCDCGETHVDDYTNATGHADNDSDGYCDADNELLDPTVECNHRCHKSGFAGFIWKVINFFNKLLGLNKTCDCGAAHY